MRSERDGFGRSRPGLPTRGRLLVGWPRPVSLLGFAAMAAIGIFGLTRGDTASSVVGAFFISIGAGGLMTVGFSRVWVDGSVLLLRMPYKGTRTLRLDRITRASISPFSQNKGPMLSLQDADGRSLTIDATNLQLKGLYIVLAQHIPTGGAGGDERLERRLRRHRPSELPG